MLGTRGQCRVSAVVSTYTRHPRALISRPIGPLRVHRTLESVILAAIGVDNANSGICTAAAATAYAKTRFELTGFVACIAGLRHSDALIRLSSNSTAFGLMTDMFQ